MDFSDRHDDDYLRECCPYLDMAELSCSSMDRKEILALIDKVRLFGCRRIVIATRGSLGSMVSINGRLYEQSPCLVDATDTMAAGDSFITSFMIHYVGGIKEARDFPEGSGTRGITTREEFDDCLVRVSLYKAAVFSAQNCQREGSFGFGKHF
jgi:sugar/nucleoside kinase (ribokinase family)